VPTTESVACSFEEITGTADVPMHFLRIHRPPALKTQFHVTSSREAMRALRISKNGRRAAI
jgi:hypothetical protein